jgi:hypothetical protein
VKSTTQLRRLLAQVSYGHAPRSFAYPLGQISMVDPSNRNRGPAIEKGQGPTHGAHVEEAAAPGSLYQIAR